MSENYLGKIKELEEIENLSEEIIDRIQTLIKYCSNDDSEVRFRAVEALGLINLPEVKNQVVRSLIDQDELVRVAALEILGDWKVFDALNNIIELLDDEDELVRSEAVIAIGNIGDKDKIHVLQQQLPKSKEEEKIRIYYALTKLGEYKYFKLFLEGLDHEFYRIRCATANLILDLITSENSATIIDVLSKALVKEKTVAAKSSIENALHELTEKR